MSVKKIIGQVHLWLGLLSGLVVFIVGITGCLYVFQDEIQKLTVNRATVISPREGQSYLPPSVLIRQAEKHVRGHKASAIRYETGLAAWIPFWEDNESFEIFLNPYNGHLLKTKHWKKGDPNQFDFFGWALDGHLNLWLPFRIGRPIETYGILIFAIELITGLVLWWPKNLRKQNTEKSFTVKWKAKFKRLNYDLHNVLGFYSLLIALMIAITGLVWGFQWVSTTLYWVTTAGGKPTPWKDVFSDSTFTGTPKQALEDGIWERFWLDSLREKGSIHIGIPKKPKDTWFVNANGSPGRLYRQEIYYFDKNTGKELHGGGVFSQNRYRSASFAEKGDRMNYDLHVGSIFGLPTKILWFFISFIVASLPITGFLIWYNRKWGKKKKKKVLSSPSHRPKFVSKQTRITAHIKETDENSNGKYP